MVKGVTAFAVPVGAMTLASLTVSAPMAVLAAGLVATWLLALWLLSDTMRLESGALALRQQVRDLRAQLEAARLTIDQVGRVDSVTGLFNAHYLQEILHREWARAERAGSPLAVIVADIDYFQAYAEGNAAGGDELLRKVGLALSGVIKRPGDLLARVSGAQFSVILPDTDLDGATVIAERLRLAVESLHEPHGFSQAAPYVTLSAGVAIRVPTRQSTENDLLRTADQTLEGARRAGGNRVVPLNMAA